MLTLLLILLLAPQGACKHNSVMTYLFMTPLSPDYYRVDPEVRQANRMASIDTSHIDGQPGKGIPSEVRNHWIQLEPLPGSSNVAFVNVPRPLPGTPSEQEALPNLSPSMNSMDTNPLAANSLPSPYSFPNPPSNSQPVYPTSNSFPASYPQPVYPTSSPFPASYSQPVPDAFSQPTPNQFTPQTIPIFQGNQSSTGPTYGDPQPNVNHQNIIYRGAEPQRRPVFTQTQFEEPISRPLGQLSMKKEDLTDRLQVDPNLAHRAVSRPQEQSFPRLESLADGGDGLPGASVRGDLTLAGINPEDTLVVYENNNGRHSVQPSNRVHVYSPRFGSVRRVEGFTINEQKELATAANGTTKFSTQRRAIPTGSTAQEESALYARSKTQLEGTRGRFQGGEMAGLKSVSQTKSTDLATSFSMLLLHEKIEARERVQLAQGKTNAICWSGAQGLLVRANELALREMHGIDAAATVFQIDDGQTVREIRLIKVADKETAAPGEIVEFTLRFENTGSEILQNITVLDSLTGRLEFLPDSAKSSVPASFYVEPNEAGSMVLRWELAQPLKPREFGVVVFQCRVR